MVKKEFFRNNFLNLNLFPQHRAVIPLYLAPTTLGNVLLTAGIFGQIFQLLGKLKHFRRM
jgi:hypothetical protein